MNKENTSEEKIQYISSLEESISLGDSDFSNLVELAEDEDSEVRYRVAELLALFPSEESERLLVAMCNDTDYMVRVSACDSLAFSKSIETLKILFKAAKDKRFLVRGYAILSIGDIQNNIGINSNGTIDFLKQLFQKESSEWVRIAISHSLYHLGEYSFGDYLLEKLNSRYYQNRCAVLNSLDQLYDNNMIHNMPGLLPILTKRFEIESAYSVKEHLQRFIHKIMNQAT